MSLEASFAVALALALALVVACDKSGSSGAAAGDASTEAAAAASVAPPASAASASSARPNPAHAGPAPAPPPAVVAGLGEVPAWTGDTTTGRCVVGAAAKPRLAAIQKGTDASLTAGTADVPALVKEVGADTCFTTRKALAAALFEAGVARHDAKSLEEATRYWRAALVVRPSLVVARYRLARGLAATGKREAAITQLTELARAALANDANAVVSLDAAKRDAELESVRSEPAVVTALEAARWNDKLVPRKDAEVVGKTVAMLPEEFLKMRDAVGATPTGGGLIGYKPAVTTVWTWHPDASTELIVALVIDDPAKAGKPKLDLHMDYGALAVLKRDEAHKLTLITVRKTGESPPTIAAGKDGALIYSFEQVCGGLSGVLSWNGTSVELHEKNCREL